MMFKAEELILKNPKQKLVKSLQVVKKDNSAPYLDNIITKQENTFNTNSNLNNCAKLSPKIRTLYFKGSSKNRFTAKFSLLFIDNENL